MFKIELYIFSPQSHPNSTMNMPHVSQGCYLGHPNLAACRGGHQPSCMYISMDVKNVVAGSGYCKQDINMYASATGILEYNAHTFNGAVKGDLYFGGYKQASYHATPGNAPTSVVWDADDPNYPSSFGIDFFHAPAGVHMVAQYDDKITNDVGQGSNFVFNIPSDPVVVESMNPSLYDIVPNKAARTQKNKNTFVIGGVNFQYLPGALLGN